MSKQIHIHIKGKAKDGVYEEMAAGARKRADALNKIRSSIRRVQSLSDTLPSNLSSHQTEYFDKVAEIMRTISNSAAACSEAIQALKR